MLTTFCCMRLNTAGIVIGWIGAAFSLLGIVLLSLGLANINDLASWLAQELQKNDTIDVDAVRKGLLVALSVYLVLVAVNLVSSSLLILGTVRERHLLLVPWLLNSGLSLFFTAIYYLAMVGMQLADGESFGVVIVSIISSGFVIAFHFLIWYAIYSLFKQIQAQREQQRQLLPRTTVGTAAYPSYTKM